MKKIFGHVNRLWNLNKKLTLPLWQYFKQGYQARLFLPYAKAFVVRHLQEFVSNLRRETNALGSIHGERFKKLQKLTFGLHHLLPKDSQYSYSILMVYSNEPFDFFKRTLESALNQTAPCFEVLLSHAHDKTAEIEACLKEGGFWKNSKLKIIRSDKTQVENFNSLAQIATGNFLQALRIGDWLRPDYLFRCEQFLRMSNLAQPPCLYTNEFEINEKGFPVINKSWEKPLALNFPYHFKDDVGNSLLVPKKEWELAGGLCLGLSSHGLWDLALRLDLLNVTFCSIPFPLYAYQTSSVQPIDGIKAFITHLESYTLAKGLNWRWQDGLLAGNLRAIPKLEVVAKIHVIIPFKDQKELTLKAVLSVLSQQQVDVVVTAIDNNSSDLSISKELESLGVEVLSVMEPFNYSRLNNFGVQQSVIGQDSDYLLFLNNDVELESNALYEMSLWADQPGIGLVGACLMYPNGLLQHGGVDIVKHGNGLQVIWSHTEKMREPLKWQQAKTLRLADAATAACAMVKRALFEKVSGFDEIWYPVAYSDTNLAVKLDRIGFKSFYTPYARGVHYESVSRTVENVEDVETSRWLHDLFLSAASNR